MGCTCAVVKDKSKPKYKRSVCKRGIHPISFTDAMTKLDISERQIFQLQQSWKGISRQMEYTGINMFIRIFETHEDLKKFFFVIENCETISEIRESKSLAKHVVMVMNTMGETIYNLNNIEYVTEMLHDIGKRHRTFSDFRREFFLTSVLITRDKWLESVTDPFLLAVKETLGDRFTPNIEVVYRKIIQFIIDNLFQGFGDTAERSSVITSLTTC